LLKKNEIYIIYIYISCFISRKEACKQYINYLKKPLIRENKSSILSRKKFYKWKDDTDKWKAINTKKSGVDLKVPSSQQVKDWYKETESPSLRPGKT